VTTTASTAFAPRVYSDAIDDEDRRRTKLTKAMTYARRYELDRDDRLQLAQVLLWRDITSWKDLTEEQLTRILDCMEGYALINHLRWQKGHRESEQIAEVVPGPSVQRVADG
jgi:hypothetical protein